MVDDMCSNDDGADVDGERVRLDPELVTYCQDRGVPVFPGVSSASEIQAAYNLGLRQVKYFPAEASGGVTSLKASLHPFTRCSLSRRAAFTRTIYLTTSIWIVLWPWAAAGWSNQPSTPLEIFRKSPI